MFMKWFSKIMTPEEQFWYQKGMEVKYAILLGQPDGIRMCGAEIYTDIARNFSRYRVPCVVKKITTGRINHAFVYGRMEDVEDILEQARGMREAAEKAHDLRSVCILSKILEEYGD